MKVAILIVSLMVNLVFFARITWRASRPDPALPQVVGRNVIPVVQSEKKVVEVKGQATVITQNWTQVEAPDYPTYIKNLREIHCPEETIRDIIISDVLKLYGQRFQEARGEIDPAPTEFWQTRQNWKNGYKTEADKSRTRTRLEFTADRKDLIRSLLNVDLDTELQLRSMDDPEVGDDIKLAFLPEGRRREVRALQQRYENDLELLKNEQGPDGYTPEQYEQYRKIRQDWESGLDHLLSPDEKQTYLMSGSQIGEILRTGTGNVTLSQEEFHKLFKILVPFESAMMENQMSPENEKEQKDFSKLAEKLFEDAKQAIGPDRFKEIENSQEGSYKEFAGLSNRYGLSPELAPKAHAARKALEAQVEKLKADPSLSDAQKKATARKLVAETERVLTQLYGFQAFDWHKRVDGGWLKNLSN